MIDLRSQLIAPDSAISDILYNTSGATSPFTGSVQNVELPGARWQLTFNYEKLDSRYGRVLKALKVALRGGAVVAHIYDLSYIGRRTVELGTPVVSGAGQTGNNLATSGWPVNTAVLEVGDQISYLASDGMYRMHMVMAAVSSNASGLAVIPILPPLRNPPVASLPVTSVMPSVSVTLTDGGSVNVNGMLHSASFVFTEALYGI